MGHLQRFHHVPKHRIHVIPNAIDAGPTRGRSSGGGPMRFRNKLGLAPEDLVGLFVGHNFWLKGLKPLLHALARRKRRRTAGPADPARRLRRRLGRGHFGG